MKDVIDGWVIVNIGHPRNGARYIVGSTFSYKRTNAIKNFVSGSGNDWRYWKEKFNFRCVRADQTLTVKDADFKTLLTQTNE